MNWYEKIKRYYDKGLYSKEQVWEFVVAKKITEDEYYEIVGRDEIVEETPEPEIDSEFSYDETQE